MADPLRVSVDPQRVLAGEFSRAWDSMAEPSPCIVSFAVVRREVFRY